MMMPKSSVQCVTAMAAENGHRERERGGERGRERVRGERERGGGRQLAFAITAKFIMTAMVIAMDFGSKGL